MPLARHQIFLYITAWRSFQVFPAGADAVQVGAGFRAIERNLGSLFAAKVIEVLDVYFRQLD